MAPIEELLRRQLDAYPETWKEPYLQAMEVWELEEVLRSGLSIFGTIEALLRHRKDEIERGRRSFDLAEMQGLQKLYAAWLGPAHEMIGDIARCEANGFVVGSARKFREACRAAKEVAGRNFDEKWRLLPISPKGAALPCKRFAMS